MVLIRCESTKEHQKDIMCSKEIGLHAHNMLAIFKLNSHHDGGPI